MLYSFLIPLNLLALTLLCSYRRELGRFFKSHERKLIGVLSAATVVFGYFYIYETRSSIRDFFFHYRDTFTGIGYTAVSVSLLLTVFQLRDTKRKARANLSYQIYKDGVEMSNLIDRRTRQAIWSKEPDKLNECLKETAKEKIFDHLQWFAAIHRQKRFDNIEDAEWKMILESFRTFGNWPLVKKCWKEIRKRDDWDTKFIKLGDNVFNMKGGKDEKTLFTN
jgi:hypothetical protein